LDRERVHQGGVAADDDVALDEVAPNFGHVVWGDVWDDAAGVAFSVAGTGIRPRGVWTGIGGIGIGNWRWRHRRRGTK